MTENDRGTPRDPDPETPHTPSEPSFGAERAPASGTPQEPTRAAPGEPDPNAPHGTHGAHAAYGQPGAPAAPTHGYAPTPPKNDLGVWALVTGILSFVVCPLLLGIAAIITGHMSRKAADAGLANNRGMGTAGLVLGWINVVLTVLFVAFIIVGLAAGWMSGSFGTWNEWKGPGDLNY